MISYDKLWITLEKKKVSQYQLINKHHVSRGLIDRLKKNESVTMHTIDTLCVILDCDVEDIVSCGREKQENEEEK